MQKTKATNRVLSLVLAVLMVLSLFPAMTLNVSAADSDEPANSTTQEPGDASGGLADGSYIVPVKQINWNNGNPANNISDTISSRGLLNVANGEYTLRLRIQCSDIYEYMWVLDQQYNELVPKSRLFNSSYGTDVKEKIQTLTNGDAWLQTQTGVSFTEENNGHYIGYDITTNNKACGYAYVVISLRDYTKPFRTQFYSIAEDSHFLGYSLKLDLENAFLLEDLMNSIENGSASLSLDRATFKTANSNSSGNANGFDKLLYGTAEVVYQNGKATATLPLMVDVLQDSPLKAINALTNKNYDTPSSYRDTAVSYKADYEEQCWHPGMDKAQVTFDVMGIIFGTNIMADTEDSVTGNSHYYACAVLVPGSIKDIVLENNTTGVKLYSKSDVLKESYVLNVEINNDISQYDSDVKQTFEQYSSSAYDQSLTKRYFIFLTDESGQRVEVDTTKCTLTIPMGDNNSETDYVVHVYSEGGAFRYSSETDMGNTGLASIDNGVFSWKPTSEIYSFNGSTFVIAKPAAVEDISDLEDGVYSVTATLMKSGQNIASMANAALNNEAHLVIKDGIKRLYFKANTMIVLGHEWYIGELICDDPYVVNKVFDNSITYLQFATDEKGELLSNADYDPVTEYPCIMGGILTLENNSYNENRKTYTLAVGAPAMAAISGLPFNEIIRDDLTVDLLFTDIKPSSLTEKQISAMYPFDSSALLRPIRLAEILIDSGDYTTESVNNLKAALDVAYPVYETDFKDNLAAASDAYEEQINLVQAAIDALVLDTSAVGDKTELQALVDTAKAIDTAAYTDSTASALTDAITAAQAVLDKDGAKQTKIDEAKEALQAAIDALVEKDITDYDKDNLPDGEYTLYATMQKAGQPETYSMSNNAIDHNVKLTVATVNGEKQYTLTVDFNGMTIKLGGTAFFGYLKDLSYYDQGYTYNNYGMPTGVRKAVTIESYQTDANGAKIADDFGTDYPDIMSFPLVPQAINDDYVPLHVFVPIMESISTGSGDQEVLMKLDWSSLKKAETDPCADGHKTEVKNAKDATCTEAGYTGDEVCTVCGKTVKQGETIAAKGHTWGEWKVTKAATTGAEGEQTRTCSVCGETEKRSIPKLDVKNPFVDVAQGQYYYDPVLWAVNHDPQITNGTDNTHFSPMGTCTRGQVVTFLWRAKGCPEPAAQVSSFSDVQDTSKYYYKAVLWASEQGITTGYADGTFRPDEECTRAHVVTFLWRAEGNPAAVGSNPFHDVPNGKYYAPAVVWALETGVTTGVTATTFAPDKPCTRAQIVTFLYRDMA